MTPVLSRRFPVHTCNRCQKRFGPGDRVTPVYIFERSDGPRGNFTPDGAYMTGEFEMEHQDCGNPGMHPGLIVGVR